MTTTTTPTSNQIDTRMKLAIETYAELTEMTVLEAKTHIKTSVTAQEIVTALCFVV